MVICPMAADAEHVFAAYAQLFLYFLATPCKNYIGRAVWNRSKRNGCGQNIITEQLVVQYMKLLFYTLLSCAALWSKAFAEKPTEKKVEIVVSGIEQQEGNILVAIFDSDDSFLKKDYWSRLYPLSSENSMHILIENLPEGEYAVSVVHDQNGNGLLDTNFLGIPKEPFGFSNNPRLKLGPPSFSDSKFFHRGEGTTLDIVLTTFRR